MHVYDKKIFISVVINLKHYMSLFILAFYVVDIIYIIYNV